MKFVSRYYIKLLWVQAVHLFEIIARNCFSYMLIIPIITDYWKKDPDNYITAGYFSDVSHLKWEISSGYFCTHILHYIAFFCC